MENQWYKEIEDKEILLQGDIINNCPIIIPPNTKYKKGEIITSEVEEYNVIIMSQSCDLVRKKIEFVLVSPIWTLGEFEKSSDFFKSRNGKNDLRNGFVFGYHLLDRCYDEQFNSDYIVVDFRFTFSISLDFLLQYIKNFNTRKRLNSPYRERLSQAFGIFFMRVGLPVEIPEF